LETLLQIENLRVVFHPRDGQPVAALDGVSLELGAGEVVGILGESGSGKTTLGLSLLKLLPESVKVSGSIRFRGQELLALKERQLQRIRGAEISMIFQEPGLALHPMLRAGEQVADVIRAHSACTRGRCRQRAELALEHVCLRDIRRIYHAYPHELSGGERQRVAIAQAVACQPSLLIADEPTGSLDSTVQAEILNLFRDLNAQLGVAILMISHNPAVLDKLARRICVMSCGRIVEQGSLREILSNPSHRYTQALAQCFSDVQAQAFQTSKLETGNSGPVI
jgi:ABC-type dipeptide/oligopeptide/nickel transport system ATPase component